MFGVGLHQVSFAKGWKRPESEITLANGGLWEHCCVWGRELRKEAHGPGEALSVFPEVSMQVTRGVSEHSTCVCNTLIHIAA